jgi:small subunit ribosomal protein S16
MSVKIRMSRHGRRHRPFFRINVIDSRTPRDGKIIEKLGHYDPLEKNSEKDIVLDLERVKFWLDKGAVPSDAVSEILLRKGIKHKYAAEKKAIEEAQAKAKADAKAAAAAPPAAEKPKEENKA